MRRPLIITIFFISIIWMSANAAEFQYCNIKSECISSIDKSSSTKCVKELDISIIRQDILCMFLAYPDCLKDLVVHADGRIYLVASDGTKLLYDDGKEKNQSMKLINPDLQDMLEQPYPINNIKDLMQEDFDPGRARAYGLLNKAYGSTRKQIESNLTLVNINGKNMNFNSNNGAAAALNSVMRQLDNAAKHNPKLYAFFVPCSGTYNYRNISGTSRLSAHAYGIAIDLAGNRNDYWKWTSRERGAARVKEYPEEIVNIFESNYFIWGGKWGHFDILHFEYRPEIIIKAKLVHNSQEHGMWYSGIDMDDNKKAIIEKIERLIK